MMFIGSSITLEKLVELCQLKRCSSAVDPLATPAMIRSWSCQQANQQHLMFIAHPLYPITIDHKQHSPLTYSSPSIPSSSLSPSIHMSLSKVLVPHLFCLQKPHTLITNASIAMSQHRLQHLAMTPEIHYLPFYSSLPLLLWSPILPEPQACLATPHQFLDLVLCADSKGIRTWPGMEGQGLETCPADSY